MARLKIWLVLFSLFASSIMAQPFLIKQNPSVLGGTGVSGLALPTSVTPYTDSLTIYLASGLNQSKIDSIVAPTGYTLVTSYNDSLVFYGDTLYPNFTKDVSASGSFDDNFIVYHSQQDSFLLGISGLVIYSDQLIVSGDSLQTDTLDFGTTYGKTFELIFTNYTASDKIGISMLFSDISTFAPTTDLVQSVKADSTDSMSVGFFPANDTTYSGTLIVTHSGGVDPDTIYLVGTGVGTTSPVVTSPSIAISDSNRQIVVSIEDGGDKTGYRLYRKYSDAGSYSLLTTAVGTGTYTYTDHIPYYLNTDYYAEAYNSTDTVSSDTVTVRQIVASGLYKTLKASGGDYATIQEANDSLPSGYTLLCYTGETFTDVVLETRSGSEYSTYGGSTKAQFGDTTYMGWVNTIKSNATNVILSHLEVHAYKNADGNNGIISIWGGNTHIRHCNVFGSEYSHTNKVIGIETKALITDSISVTYSTIRDFDQCLYLRTPYNVEIAYNTIYDAYRYDGKDKHGQGGKLIRSYHGPDNLKYSSDYKFRIHHNNLYNFEHSAIACSPSSRFVVEYNEIHHSLDDRLFFGSSSHGYVSKITDDAGFDLDTALGYAPKGYIGAVGAIYRYNYVHNIYKHAEIGKTYSRPTPAQIEAGQVQVYDADNGQTEQIRYVEANGDSVYYGVGIGLFQMVGYSQTWIHNNLIYRCDRTIFRRGSYKKVEPQYNDMATYVVNNTVLQGGHKGDAQTQMRGFYGQYQQNDDVYAPTYIYNNIFDHNVMTIYGTATARDTDNSYFDKNIFTNNSGRYTTSTATAQDYVDKNAIYFYKTTDPYPTGVDYGDTDPEWQDSATTFFAPNIGVAGVNMPDVRIKKDGNAYNLGKSYATIGDNYLDTVGTGGTQHVVGYDHTGRSIAYDMLGNYRTTNDIGALGIPQDTIISVTPEIITDPSNIVADLGDTIQFSVVASLRGGALTYQWRNYETDVALSDTSKFSGLTTNTLTVKNIGYDLDQVPFYCRVINANLTTEYANSNSAYYTILGTATPDQDTLTLASGNADVYKYGTNLNKTLEYVLFGHTSQPVDAGFVFSGMEEWASIDSAVVYFTVPTGSNISNTAPLLVRIRDDSAPTDYSSDTHSSFVTRYEDTLSVNDDVTITAQWYAKQTYGIDVTNCIRLADDSFTYSNGTVELFFLPDGTGSQLRRKVETYETVGGTKAYMIIYGTK